MSPVVQLFCDIVQVPSPTGQELQFGEYLRDVILKKVPTAQVYFDESGKINNSNSGNLIAHITPQNTGPKLAVVCHMDTVEDGETPVIPVVGKDYITSKGDTILGADNKAGIAGMLAALDFVADITNIQLTYIFTTCGEAGVFGSGLIDPVMMQEMDLIMTLESCSPAGTLVEQTVGYHHFKVDITGKSSHAGVAVEEGINSIQVAAKALAALPIGMMSEKTMLNIGTIQGGKSSNMVPASCSLEGEIRSFSIIEMNQCLSIVKNAFATACAETGASYMLHDFEKIPPYLLNENHAIVQQIKDILRTIGPVHKVKQRAFNDVNILAQYGPATVNIARGGEHPHTSDENIAISELEKVATIMKGIVTQI